MKLNSILSFTVLLLLLVGCFPEDIYVEEEFLYEGRYQPEALMVFPTDKDDNGFYHVDLDWNREYYPYFNVDVEADKLSRDESIISARFDTDTYWVIEDSIAFTIPLYSPFLGLQTFQGTPIPVRDTIVYLNQFKGTVLPVVQNNTRIYFKENQTNYTSRRVVGPFPPELIGDTITLHMKVTWEYRNTFIDKEFVEKFIVE